VDDLYNKETVKERTNMAKKELTYESAKARAEAIVREIESGDIDLDQIAAKLKECRELLLFCREKIYNVDTEIKKILTDDDKD
jgi:exodeoxyribonuclease VII small subunit